MSIYNGWISKTNWTLVALFVVTAGNAIDPLLPTGVQATVSTLLLLLAGYFHVSGVNKAALASATAGTPTSGQ